MKRYSTTREQMLAELADKIASLEPACEDLLPALRAAFRAGHKQCSIKVRRFLLDLIDENR